MPPEAQPGEAFGLLRSRHLQAICKSRISDFISNWIIKLVDETASCVRALGLIFVPMYFMNLEGRVKGEGPGPETPPYSTLRGFAEWSVSFPRCVFSF